MPEAPRSCWIDERDSRAALHLGGEWRLAGLRELSRQLDERLRELRKPPAVVDGAALRHIDTAAALLLLHTLGEAGTDVAALALRGFEPSHERIVEVVRGRFADTVVQPRGRALSALADFGRRAAALGTLLAGHVEFFGRTLAEFGRVLLRPRLLRLHELFAQLGQVGVNAIPVVALVTYLIGVVVAYMLGLQAEKYGANIFVVDGVALAMTREFSPLIVATIMAGRSGAAFTAQLGTMKLTEEIDAIRTLGLSAPQVLVVPRVLALVLTLPLLVFVGDVAGLAGAMLMAQLTLDIEPGTFMERLHVALAPRHYVIGLVKAPVFALFIAVIGCRMGLSVSRDTRSIGIHTTSTVVQGIVAVILLDAVFAVVLQKLDL
ncbi:MAG TPA: ABC transporter permease [Rubrivivax sp.]|nr:ABC transporter permease [Rubrivivax sp.]